MKLFRTQKPSKQTPSSSNASRSPPLSADSPSLRALSSRIEPYTLGSPSPPPSSATQVHSDGGPYANGNMYASGGIGQAQREGSIHSQQDKSWTRGLFGGGTTGRQKEANAELMRMIGFLIAAAPDDWNLVLEVCERASANESAAKEAARALRREIRYGEPPAQLSAARLWAIMLQNATDILLAVQTASQKFLENLEEVVNSEATSPVVRERILDVLASAAFVYGKKPGKEGFASTWRKLRPAWKPAEGVPFDQEDALFESAFPRRAGVGAGPGGVVQGMDVPVGVAGIGTPIQQQQQVPPANYGPGSREDRRRDKDRDKYLAQQRAFEASQQYPQSYHVSPASPVPSRRDRGIIPPEEDRRWLLQECDMARNNAQVLSQALPFATPTTLGTDPLIYEFHTKCRASQELIVAQIPWASAGVARVRLAAQIRAEAANKPLPPDGSTKEEKLLSALLTAGQELVDVFRIYEELEKLAFDEMEEREVAKRSKAETRLDRTHIQYIAPDGSLLMEPPASQGASSSRSASPAIPSLSSRTTSAGSLPPNATSPAVAVAGKGSARDLPHPPPSPGHFLSPSSPAGPPPLSDLNKQWPSNLYPQDQLLFSLNSTKHQQPQIYPAQVPPIQLSTEIYPLSQSASVFSPTGPRVAPHGPRRPAGHSRTPSPDRNADLAPSHVPSSVANINSPAQLYTVPEPPNRSPPSVLVEMATARRNSSDEGDFTELNDELDQDLEKLMMTHLPSDLTGQVVIPNERNRAHGGLADVYTGILGGNEVAVKVLRIRKSRRSDADWEASNERRIKREMHVWAALKHQNVCEFLGYSTEFSDYPALISTWCHGGTTSEYLDSRVLSIQERIALTQDVGAGLQYLHQLKVIHGDLKPTNILVDNAGMAKLCDFGLVRLADWEGPAGMTTTSPYTGTERYKAPELFMSAENRHPVATFEGDIYSLGSIILEFIEQTYPFKRFRRPQDLREAIIDREPPALRKESVQPLHADTGHLWDLLENCWDEPASRPSIRVVNDALDYFAERMYASGETGQNGGPD